MNFRRMAVAVFCAFSLSAWGAVPRLAAQQNPLEAPQAPDGRIPITLVLAESGRETTLLRRAGSEPRNVILLAAATVDAQQLSDAVFHLLILEAQDPWGHRRADNAAQRVRLDAPHPVYPWAGEALERLRTAAAQPIRSLGGRQRRTVQIWATPLRPMRR